MGTTCKKDLLRKIAGVLERSELTDDSQIYAEDSISMESIKIEIDEVGELSFPLSDSCFKKLINISTKARFGSGEQTLLDENIRNTHQITSDKLHVTFNQEALDSLMYKLRSSLGFKDDCILTPHLHNLLIYEPGQFFDMHQDSEKLESMVGTLVIVLPNAHIGGDLVIELGKMNHVFSSECLKPVDAKCIAFYADCKHKIEKVKDGHRIALTFNLVLKAKDPVLPSLVNKQLCEVIKEYFDLKEEKQMLVFFLDHSYSEHGLKWNLLKGEDRAHSLEFCSVANSLGLISHLALVEIKKVFDVEYTDEPTELINEEATLTFWIDSDNEIVHFSEYDVSENNICFTKSTSLFEPYHTESEGYTGNEGCTADYWYKRAAIVLWPESAKFSMNFLLAYDKSLKELCELCKTPGNQKKVMEIVAQALKYVYKPYSEYLFYGSTSSENERSNFMKFAGIASYVEDSKTAISLLSNFKWRTLSCDLAEHLANLQSKYGVEWCINLLKDMKSNSLESNLDNIDLLIKSVVAHKIDDSILKLFLNVQCETFKQEITNNKRASPASLNYTLPERIKKLQEFINAILICKDFTVLSEMIQNVISNVQQYPLTSLAKLYVEVHESAQPEDRIHFQDLKTYLIKSIDHKIISGTRKEDDWSIKAQLRCDCEICEKATAFLHSKTEKTKVWPLKEKLRKHLASKGLYNPRLPVKITVEKTGSPHKLVLTKTEKLHQDAAEECKELKLYQQKLRALNE